MTKKNFPVALLVLTQLCCVAVLGQSQSIRREEQDATTRCEDTARRINPTFNFSTEMIDTIMVAARISDLTYDVFPPISDVTAEEAGFDMLETWCDLDDAAIVARDGTTCYGAFRGTVGLNPLDAYQLYNPFTAEYKGCEVRKGFLRAYESSYEEELRQAIATCMESGTALVLTGHSQGGSVAVIASLDLKDYNPTVISFGSVRVLCDTCSEIDSSTHYRFVNVGDKVYDAWVNRFGRQGIHVGQGFLIDERAQNPGVYLGLDADLTRNPQSTEVHTRDKYWAALNNMVKDQSNGIVTLAGWEDGHWCTYSDECKSGSCINHACGVQNANDELCSDDSDCQSCVCRRTSLFSRQRCS